MHSAARQALRQAVFWLVLACAGIATALYHDAILKALTTAPAVEEARPRATPVPTSAQEDAGFAREVRLKADRSGHFAVQAHVNDRPLALLADTGATLVTLTYEDARSIGFAPAPADFTQRTQTANGIALAAPVVLDRMRVGDIVVRDVRALVAEPGRLPVNLLGMSFIGALSRVEMQGGELVLVQ